MSERSVLKELFKYPRENVPEEELKKLMPWSEALLVFILAEMYRRSGGTDTAVPVEVYRQTGTGYRLHHSG